MGVRSVAPGPPHCLLVWPVRCGARHSADGITW